MALTGQRIAMVDMGLLVFLQHFHIYRRGGWSQSFTLKIFFSCSLGGGGGRYFSVPCPWVFFQRPLTLILIQSIAIQMWAVSWYKLVAYIQLSDKRRAYFLQRSRDRNGRCIAILLRSVGVKGPCDSPYTPPAEIIAWIAPWELIYVMARAELHKCM